MTTVKEKKATWGGLRIIVLTGGGEKRIEKSGGLRGRTSSGGRARGSTEDLFFPSEGFGKTSGGTEQSSKCSLLDFGGKGRKFA